MKPGHETPVNRVAARILRAGVHHEHDVKPGATEWENPPIMYPSPHKGMVNGRITVWGSLSPTAQRQLICRCNCGRWVLRTPKAMRNRQEGKVDMCSQCYGLARMKRNEYHRRTGIWKDTETFY